MLWPVQPRDGVFLPLTFLVKSSAPSFSFNLVLLGAASLCSALCGAALLSFVLNLYLCFHLADLVVHLMGRPIMEIRELRVLVLRNACARRLGGAHA